MIYDRVAADVTQASALRKNKVAQGIPLTEAEEAVMERGCFTINTANRIESKQTELRQAFNEMGYFNCQISNRNWNLGDIFFEDDLKRISENVAILRKAFFAYQDTPANPRAEYHYREINLMERVLYDLEKMVDVVEEGYRECGAFNCGEA